MIERIAILGTGLLGTSVGLALRASGFGGSIVGWNRTQAQGEVALAMGALHSIVSDALQAARESQVVVLAVPIHSTLDYMDRAFLDAKRDGWSKTPIVEMLIPSTVDDSLAQLPGFSERETIAPCTSRFRKRCS